MRQIFHAINLKRATMIAEAEATTVSSWAWWLRQQHEDLRQEGLLKICEAVSCRVQDFRSRSAGEQHVYARVAARSGCISYLRKQKRHYDGRAPQPAEFFLVMEGWEPTPERSCLAIEQLDELQDLFIEAMAFMSPREREAFLWKLGVGPQIDVSMWTARTYSDRARAKLTEVVRRKKVGWLTPGQISRLLRL